MIRKLSTLIKLNTARDFLLADLPDVADLAPVDVAAVQHVIAILDKLAENEDSPY
jgi:hypothetical protein